MYVMTECRCSLNYLFCPYIISIHFCCFHMFCFFVIDKDIFSSFIHVIIPYIKYNIISFQFPSKKKLKQIFPPLNPLKIPYFFYFSPPKIKYLLFPIYYSYYFWILTLLLF